MTILPLRIIQADGSIVELGGTIPDGKRLPILVDDTVESVQTLVNRDEALLIVRHLIAVFQINAESLL